MLIAWEHISQQQYLKEYEEIDHQFWQLTPVEISDDELKRLAGFLVNVANAWREANQEQRNRIARVLFEDVIWVAEVRLLL